MYAPQIVGRRGGQEYGAPSLQEWQHGAKSIACNHCKHGVRNNAQPGRWLLLQFLKPLLHSFNHCHIRPSLSHIYFSQKKGTIYLDDPTKKFHIFLFHRLEASWISSGTTVQQK